MKRTKGREDKGEKGSEMPLEPTEGNQTEDKGIQETEGRERSVCVCVCVCVL